MSDHLARHLLEEWLADAARIERAPELRAHLDACERCNQRLRDMERARAAFQLEHPATDFARSVSAAASARALPAPRRQRFRWAAVGGALALAAAAVLMLRAPAEPGIRFRGAGDVSMQVYVRSGNEVRLLHDGEALSGGTQLAFTYTLAEPRHLLLFGIDDAGTLTRYFPDGDIAKSSALAAGATRQLPVGIELDARRGRERVIALFSASVTDEAAARAAIEAAWREAKARGKGISAPMELALPAKQISLWFDKP